MVPPTGVIPNIGNAENRNSQAIAVFATCISLATLTALGRVYSRLFLVRKLRVEDCLGLAAYAGYGGIIWALNSQLHHGGFFVHQWDIRFRDLQKAVYSAVMLTLVYALTMIVAKTAILLEWTHIFVPDRARNTFFWGGRIMMALNILLYSCGIIAETMTCIPLATLWEPWLQGKCINKKVLDVITAYFNLVMDLFILLLPQGTIWKLQMTRKRKIGVSVIFSFGILTIACAAGRVYANQTLDYVNEGDTNYGLGLIYLWGLAEVTCVLLVFNIPALPKIFTEKPLGSWITSHVRFWTSVSSSRESSSKTSGMVFGKRGDKTNEYRIMDDHSHTQLTAERGQGYGFWHVFQPRAGPGEWGHCVCN
ncbi:hypothetical protein M434DRAFT_17799 [Hypoxylon sp. CO27-5]|nr:hypothetical protein M434DRAFT_17799 [Hypoxylon sp. CO27-5]